jgi:hypothetical protein
MTATREWLAMAAAFEHLRRHGAGRLRAEQHPGGWGRRERDALGRRRRTFDPWRRVPSRDQDTETKKRKEWRAIRKAQARAPHWYLAGAQNRRDEFITLADSAAALSGIQGPDAWVGWLDKIHAAGVGDRQDLEIDGVRSTSIRDVCAASAQYCRVLAAESQLTAAQLADRVGRDDPKSLAESRRARVDAYIKEVLSNGEQMTRTMLCRTAGVDPSEFRRWQRADPQTRRPAAGAIERVLREKPHMKGKRTR